jgi:hypothetical protein
MKLCVYDFDSVIYACASIIQQNYVDVIHKKSGKVKEFKTMTEFKGNRKESIGGWLLDTNKQKGTNFTVDDFDIIKNARVALPDQCAFDAIDSAIQAIEAKSWCKSLKLAISGRGNFRDKIMFSGVYKDGRSPKPLKYACEI